MTYLINTETTGLSNNEQVKAMAQILRDAGYDVEFTRNFGVVNQSAECPCTNAEWENALIAAEAAC